MDKQDLNIRKRRLARDFLIISISIFIAVYIHSSGVSKILASYIGGSFFIPAAFLMGIFFALTFTVAIATSVFLLLSELGFNPFLLAFFGGLGSVLANLVVYKFFKEELIDDLEVIEPNYAKKIAHKIFHSKLFIALIPYLSALALVSPLPDEVGIMMLAGSKSSYRGFLLASFIFHTIGIFLIVFLGKRFIEG